MNITKKKFNEIIKNIKSPKHQQSGINSLRKYVFLDGQTVDDVTIEKLMDPMLNMMNSWDHDARWDAVYFLHIMAYELRNAQRLIDRGLVGKLLKNLYSDSTSLLDQTLKLLANLAIGFPQIIAKGINLISKLLLSDDEDVVLQAALCLRNLSAGSIERKQAVIEAGVPELLPQLMAGNFKDSTMEEIFSVFTNIADGNTDQKQVLFDCQAVQPAVQIMNSSNLKVAGFATWGIGTLANEGTVAQKQQIIDFQALPILVSLLSSKDIRLSEYAACAIKDICESKEGVDVSVQIQAIINAGALPPLIQLLKSSATDASDESLNAFINISACDSDRCQAVLDAGVLPFIDKFLKHPKLSCKKRAMAFLENATRYNVLQVSTILEAVSSDDIVNLLDDPILQKKAVDILENIVNFKPEFTNVLTNIQSVLSLCCLLHSDDTRILRSALSTLNEMFKKTDDIEDLCQSIDNCEVRQRIQTLQTDRDPGIQRHAKNISTFFDVKQSPPEVDFNENESTEPVDEFAALRKLAVGEWEYGRDETGEIEKRIIVPEMNDGSTAREYRNEGGNMYCLGCFQIDQGRKCYMKNKDGLLYAPHAEDHPCQPRCLAEIRREQASFREMSHKRRQSLESNASTPQSKRTKYSDSPSIPRHSETPTSFNMSFDYTGAGPSRTSVSTANTLPPTNEFPAIDEEMEYNEHEASDELTTSQAELSESPFIVDENGQFKLIVDVRHYKINQLKVDVVEGQELIVAGKRKSKDRLGPIDEQFTRLFSLPGTLDLGTIECSFDETTRALEIKGNRIAKNKSIKIGVKSIERSN